MSSTQRIAVATLGDSIMAGTPGWDPDPALRDDASDPQSQFQHWAARKDERLAFRNHGVNGERTDEIARRLAEAADGVDVLVVQGGINDIVQGRAVEDAAADLRAIVGEARELGVDVLVVELLPWNRGWPAGEPKIRRLNELIHALAADHEVGVLPFHDTLEDPDRPGTMRAEWTSDGNHPSVAGYRRLGELAFTLPA